MVRLYHLFRHSCRLPSPFQLRQQYRSVPSSSISENYKWTGLSISFRAAGCGSLFRRTGPWVSRYPLDDKGLSTGREQFDPPDRLRGACGLVRPLRCLKAKRPSGGDASREGRTDCAHSEHDNLNLGAIPEKSRDPSSCMPGTAEVDERIATRRVLSRAAKVVSVHRQANWLCRGDTESGMTRHDTTGFHTENKEATSGFCVVPPWGARSRGGCHRHRLPW